MGAKLWLGGMVVGTLGVLVAVPSQPDAHRAEPVSTPIVEEPWLSHDAAAQIIGDSAGLGPLFADVELGGPAPERDVRARIATFARDNHVSIDLEITGDRLTAVRFEVTYPGCCGFEGAGVLALRLQRPKTSSCCGCEHDFLSDWAILVDDRIYTRARVRGNRVEVRWEPAMTLGAVLARADQLLGTSPRKAAREVGDRWIAIDQNHASLELPYVLEPYPWYGEPVPLRRRTDLGLQLSILDDRIIKIDFTFRNEDAEAMNAALRKRWGRPRIHEETWTWQKADRSVAAERARGTAIAISTR